MKHLTPLTALALLTGAFLANTAAHATDIGVVGLFPGKAILVVDGGAPKTYTVGSAIGSDAKLVDADRETATVIVNGKRQVLVMGQTVHRSSGGNSNSVTLSAGERGHFIAPATVNGVSINMMVDTGASLVTLPATDAVKMGLNYKAGRMGRSSTAGGIVPTYLVKIDSIKVGDVELNQVDAAVIEQGLSVPLLGNSFLNRMEMRRDGDHMTLTKKY